MSPLGRVLALFFLASSSLAGEGEGYLLRVETSADFDRLSIPEKFLPGVERETKYTVLARDDPGLLPALFQNSNLYPYHREFLAAEFPDRFPGLTGEEYLSLVERRATRSYFAGALYRFSSEAGPLYGFDVFTAGGDRSELPRVEEARRIAGLLQAAFSIGEVAYTPSRQDAMEEARGWTDPGFPVRFPFGGGAPEYLAYTPGESYGRVRILSPAAFAELDESGGIAWQDILVLDEVPSDIEGVVSGVITAEIQGELGHLAIRTARRGTPNAYLKDAGAKLAPLEGKLVHLQVGAETWDAREADLATAEAWWTAHRPKLTGYAAVDRTYDRLDAVGEIPLDGTVRLSSRYGGKGGNFARLWSLLPEENRTPGLVVPFSYYLRFLQANEGPSPVDPDRRVTLDRYIEELLADPAFRTDSAFRFQTLASLRHLIEVGTVDPSTVRALSERVAAVLGETTRARFRSSSNVEDLLEFNGAGLYTSTWACPADDLDGDSAGPSRCDPPHKNEHGVAAALKTVWASLWNFRAYEEREYYQIDQTGVAMAVLVSEAFPDEIANGVAFTGNPAVRGDRRFLVNAQVGDKKVVSPDPGVLAEKDILEMESGIVSRVIRARPSTLVNPGERVLDDGKLGVMGALMAAVEAVFPVDLGSHDPADVLLDFEFKLDRAGRLRFKQVRPFLIPAAAAQVREFRLRVPEGVTLRASFNDGRPVRQVLSLKSVLGLKAGDQILHSDGTGAADILEWLQLEPGGQRIPPAGSGIWAATYSEVDGGYFFQMAQDFAAPGGSIRVSVDHLFIPAGAPSGELREHGGRPPGGARLGGSGPVGVPRRASGSSPGRRPRRPPDPRGSAEPWRTPGRRGGSPSPGTPRRRGFASNDRVGEHPWASPSASIRINFVLPDGCRPHPGDRKNIRGSRSTSRRSPCTSCRRPSPPP